MGQTTMTMMRTRMKMKMRTMTTRTTMMTMSIVRGMVKAIHELVTAIPRVRRDSLIPHMY